eukprot:scaffold50716_cov63-Phaeocystis_antarctica.AAC.1
MPCGGGRRHSRASPPPRAHSSAAAARLARTAGSARCAAAWVWSAAQDRWRKPGLTAAPQPLIGC